MIKRNPQSKPKKIPVKGIVEKKPKIKATSKPKAKKVLVSEAKLDRITSLLVRACYPDKCFHCGVELSNKNSNACHFVTRTKRATRYSMKNLAAGDRNCNFYRPEHVYSLGNFLDNIWGEGTATMQIEMSNKIAKFKNIDRVQIYDIFKEHLDQALKAVSQEEKYKILKSAQFKYEEIASVVIK